MKQFAASIKFLFQINWALVFQEHRHRPTHLLLQNLFQPVAIKMPIMETQNTSPSTRTTTGINLLSVTIEFCANFHVLFKSPIALAIGTDPI